MERDFIPLQYLKTAVHNWWFTLLLMLVGGLTGFAVSTFIPTVNISVAPITVTIDYTRTGALSDVQEDQAMRGVGSVIESANVLDTLTEELRFAGWQKSKLELQQQVKLERENSRWLLIATGDTPEEALLITKIWMEISVNKLNNALSHAERLDAARSYLDSLTTCLGNISTINESITVCSIENADVIFEQIKKTSELIESERVLSLGLMPALSILSAGETNTTNLVTRFDSGILVFSGALIGLAFSMVLNFQFSKRKQT